MHTFRDENGRQWTLAVNVASVRRVRSLAGIDLPGLFGDEMKPLAALLSDPCKLVDVLWVLAAKQAAAAGVTEESFAEGLLGDSLQAATEALLEELVDFFPDRARREALREVLTKGKEIGARLAARAGETVRSLNPEEIAEALASRPRSSSGTAPASSASGQDDGLSGN